MIYKDALELITKYESLKGTQTDKGFNIKDIVIVPADKEKRREFISNCLLNNQKKDLYFQENTDVYIWAVDTDYLKSANILFFQDLSNK